MQGCINELSEFAQERSNFNEVGHKLFLEKTMKLDRAEIRIQELELQNKQLLKQNADMSEIISGRFPAKLPEEFHHAKSLRAELTNLKDEFEKFKIRALPKIKYYSWLIKTYFKIIKKISPFSTLNLLIMPLI